jgi:ribosome-associated protein
MALEDKKAENIILLDIHEVASFTDYFIICTGTSNRMLDSLSSAVSEQIRETYHIKGHIEGSPDGGWMVTDFGDVVVHLFSPDQRSYYQLEELWEQGKVLLRLQ